MRAVNVMNSIFACVCSVIAWRSRRPAAARDQRHTSSVTVPRRGADSGAPPPLTAALLNRQIVDHESAARRLIGDAYGPL